MSFAVAGAVSGAILGGWDGGFSGALKGAGIGFVMGAAMGAGIDKFGMPFALAAITLSAVYAGATGGLEGLGDFAGGMIGSAYGATVGNAIVGTFNTSYTQTETQAQERRIDNMIEMLNKGQLENPTGNSNGSTFTTLGNTEKANVIRDAAVKGTIGRGNNPTPTKTSSEQTAFRKVKYLSIKEEVKFLFESPLNTDLPASKTWESKWVTVSETDYYRSVPSDWVVSPEPLTEISPFRSQWIPFGARIHRTTIKTWLYGPPE